MIYLELDDIIYNIQRFGGATTYWNEMTSRLSEFVPGSIVHSTGGKFSRLYSPRSSAKVFHSSHFRVTTSRHVKNVTTIYDLIYEKGLGGGRGKIVNLYERRKSVINSDAIICISESTRCDLNECYGHLIGSKPVHVIHLGCTKLPVRLQGDNSSLIRAKYSSLGLTSGQFYLFVGGRTGYKNFELLLNAFVAGNFALRGFRIICTGAGFNDSERTIIDNLKLTDSVFSIGYVDAITLGELYGVARALVYPSAYEGFGLPALEAMAAGCPVICANTSSLPEVVGKSGIMINPNSIEQLADAMNSVLSEETREHYSQAGLARSALFDWRKSALAHSKVYESLVPF